MDLDRIIEQMHAERARLDSSIRAIELIIAAGPKGRARQAKWMTPPRALNVPSRRGRPRADTKPPE
jgi:hypothetical protein